MSTWKQLLAGESTYQGDPGPVIAYSPTEPAFDEEYRRDCIEDMFAWTETRVYFLTEMDEIGDRRFGSAPRNPPGGAA